MFNYKTNSSNNGIISCSCCMVFSWIYFLILFTWFIALFTTAIFKSNDFTVLMQNNLEEVLAMTSQIRDLTMNTTTKVEGFVTETNSLMGDHPNFFKALENTTFAIESMFKTGMTIDKTFFSQITSIVGQLYSFLMNNPDEIELIKKVILKAYNITEDLEEFEKKFFNDGVIQLKLN